MIEGSADLSLELFLGVDPPRGNHGFEAVECIEIFRRIFPKHQKVRRSPGDQAAQEGDSGRRTSVGRCLGPGCFDRQTCSR